MPCLAAGSICGFNVTTIGTVGERLSLAAIAQEPGSARVVLEGDEHSSFSNILKDALSEVAALQNEAQDAIGAFVRGDAIEIHEVMAAAEEAGIALDMLIEIRNKLTDAYRSVIQMQS